MSSSSASRSDQISPLDPVRDGSAGASGFESLGVRPRTQQQSGDVVDTAVGDVAGGSGRSTPVFRHYHHHYHHHDPQAVPGK